ncbi:MAG: sigma-70 family RNA polymerase sigma factor [Planctomycetes bacterium]|nr:sigma-70 family RNA polymerase sigma factor [Planctomycetota bacterium]
MGQHVSESTQLLRRWHQGDEGALQELLAHHLPWIRVHVRQRLGEALRAKEETGDIVQDALLEFLRYGPRFEIRNEAHLRFLLARIAENVLRDRNDFYTRRRRQAARETPFTEDGLLVLDGSARPATQPDEALERKQWRAWVRLALELLDPQDRDVIVLRTWDGLEFAEVAQRMELSVDLARVRFHRALPKLAAKIQALQRALSIFEQVASPAHRNALVCRENLMQNLLRSARFAELNALCEATLSVAASAKLERAHVALFSRMCSAFAHEGLDQLDSAIAVAEGALADFGSTRDPALENRVLYLRCALVDWYVARGDIARAETSLSASGTETEALDSAQSRGQWITWARARLELAQGRPESAAPLLETLAARQRGSSYAWWLPARARAALAELLHEKDLQRAHSLAENAEREIRERFGAEHGAARDAHTLLERLRAALR